MSLSERFVRLAAPWVRGAILRAAAEGEHLGATAVMCRDLALAIGAPCDAQNVLVAMGYLEAAGLVALERSTTRPWKARLTRPGRDIMDGTTELPRGIEQVPTGEQVMKDGLTPLHVACVRWIILSAIEAGDSFGATDAICRNVVAAAYPQATMERIRLELDYLEAGDLVTLARSEIRPWKARLTRGGRDVTDYTVEAPRGVERPPFAS